MVKGLSENICGKNNLEHQNLVEVGMLNRISGRKSRDNISGRKSRDNISGIRFILVIKLT